MSVLFLSYRSLVLVWGLACLCFKKYVFSWEEDNVRTCRMALRDLRTELASIWRGWKSGKDPPLSTPPPPQKKQQPWNNPKPNNPPSWSVLELSLISAAYGKTGQAHTGTRVYGSISRGGKRAPWWFRCRNSYIVWSKLTKRRLLLSAQKPASLPVRLLAPEAVGPFSNRRKY